MLFLLSTTNISKTVLKSSYPDIEFKFADFTYQEGIIEALKSNSSDALIISLDIEGDLDRYSFIQTIRDINRLSKNYSDYKD